ncbi:PREDICTED: neuronal cell adhesion molecule-like [Priapulus caudatus]|uniref:Neuronal cell adhesion molecule-like n=1 Tax=Priapulus caudatus TaxID=37621 RepID=A0ABM1DQ35_PRICU|nr:PREDICTED: neuronal cell adhesion molecule-like [Priapulus caudatus]
MAQCSRCQILLLVICLNTIVTAFSFFSGEITPEDDITIEEGESFNITCRPKTPGQSLPFFMRYSEGEESAVNDSDVTMIGPSHVQLYVVAASKHDDAGRYMCYLPTAGGVDDLQGLRDVYIYSQPAPLKNVSFVSRNAQDMTISWVPGDDQAYLYNVSYKVSMKSVSGNIIPWKDCPEDTGDNVCYISGSDIHPDYNYDVKIRIINDVGWKEETYHVIYDDIIKPDLPQDFKVDKNSVESSSFDLTWNHPYGMRAYGAQLAYEVKYWSEWDKSSPMEIYVGHYLNATISDLIPYTDYTLNLRTRMDRVNNYYWSNYSSIINKTAADVPYVAPAIVQGAYKSVNSDDMRNITIFWQDVAESDRNGKNFVYTLSVKSECKLELRQDTTVTSTSYTFMASKHCGSSVDIIAKNHVGKSDNKSHIYIGKASDLPAKVGNPLAVKNRGEEYEVTWDKSPTLSVSTYTIMWCDVMPPTSDCKPDSELQWEIIPASEAQWNKVLPYAQNMTLQFWVSADTAVTSSGMERSPCTYIYNGVPQVAPEFGAAGKTSRSLTVSWSKIENCADAVGLIQGYYVQYTEAQSSGPDLRWNSTRVEGISKRSVELTGLLPYTTYRFYVLAFTHAGVGGVEDGVNNMKSETTMEAVPADPPHNVAIVTTTSSSMMVAWQPPHVPNGVVAEYIVSAIYNGSDVVDNRTFAVSAADAEDAGGSSGSLLYEVAGLHGWCYYEVAVTACNGAGCSAPSDTVGAETLIGAPPLLGPPTIEIVDADRVLVKVAEEEYYNGHLEYFLLEVSASEGGDGGEEWQVTQQIDVANASGLLVVVDCDGERKYDFRVAAVTFDGSETQVGPYSEAESAMLCIKDVGFVNVGIIIGCIIGAVIVTVILVAGCCRLKNRMDKHAKEDIDVVLPQALPLESGYTPMSSAQTETTYVPQPDLVEAISPMTQEEEEEAGEVRDGSDGRVGSYKGDGRTGGAPNLAYQRRDSGHGSDLSYQRSPNGTRDGTTDSGLADTHYVTIGDDDDPPSKYVPMPHRSADSVASSPAEYNGTSAPPSAGYSRMAAHDLPPYATLQQQQPDVVLNPKRPSRDFIVGAVTVPTAPGLPPRNLGGGKQPDVELTTIEKPKGRFASGDSDDANAPYARLGCKGGGVAEGLAETEMGTPRRAPAAPHYAQLAQLSSDSGFPGNGGASGYVTEAEASKLAPEAPPGGTATPASRVPWPADARDADVVSLSTTCSEDAEDEDDGDAATAFTPRLPSEESVAGVPAPPPVANCCNGYVEESAMPTIAPLPNGHLPAPPGGVAPTKQLQALPPNGFVLNSGGYVRRGSDSDTAMSDGCCEDEDAAFDDDVAKTTPRRAFAADSDGYCTEAAAVGGGVAVGFTAPRVNGCAALPTTEL